MANSFPVSDHVAAMQGSSTLIAAQLAGEMRARGEKVIDLSVGEPDFDTPQFIKDYAVEGLNKGLTKYTATAGTADFRRSIADFYAARFGAELDTSEIAKFPSNGFIALEAANPEFKTRIFGPDQVDIQGRLVGLIRRY